MGDGPRRRGRPPRRLATLRRPPTRRATATFEAVVEAAARVLVTHGIGGLTTNRIAEVAGVSIGSVYQYFPNKESIVSALIERHLPRLSEIVGGAIERCDSIDGALRSLVESFLRFSPEERVLFGHLFVLRTDAGAHERIAAHLAVLVEQIAVALARIGLASPDDARPLAFVMVHTGDGLLNALARSPSSDAARAAAIYTTMLHRYLAAST
jgi:AcrR family transcriptional regulator